MRTISLKLQDSYSLYKQVLNKVKNKISAALEFKGYEDYCVDVDIEINDYNNSISISVQSGENSSVEAQFDYNYDSDELALVQTSYVSPQNALLFYEVIGNIIRSRFDGEV